MYTGYTFERPFNFDQIQHQIYSEQQQQLSLGLNTYKFCNVGVCVCGEGGGLNNILYLPYNVNKFAKT